MQTHDSSAPRLLNQVRDRIRRKHYSIRTEEAYLHWVKAFVRFHGLKHPASMGAPEVESYLTYLAVERHVSSSTQNQALSGLLFLYREVLEIELPWLDGIERSKRPKRMPVVLTREEVTSILDQLDGTTALILTLAYGTGMRIMEVVRLRVKDVEFTRGEILIREGKCFCRLPWHANIPRPRAIGAGNTCFHRTSSASIRGQDVKGATMPIRRTCSGACGGPCSWQAFPSPRRHTRFGTPLPRICSNPATTFAPSRNCWATRMCRRR